MIDKEIKAITFLNKFNRNFKNNKTRFVTNNKVFTSAFLYFLHISQNEEFSKMPLKDIFLNYFSRAEKSFPGSSQFLSNLVVSDFLNNIKNTKKYKNTKKSEKNIRKYLETKTKKEYVDIFFEILNFSGPDATLICKKSDIERIKVSKKNTSYFNVDIDDRFLGVYFSNVKETTKTFIVSIMDAYIERESDLMPLLDEAKIKKLPVLLLCRGMSDYCAKNLKNILLRNKVYIYPYTSKFCNNDPFLFEDISHSLNIKMINSEVGDSILKNSVEKSKIKSLKISSSKIYCTSENEKIVKEISEKLSKTNDNELKNYLLNRKKRLSTNIVEIDIPKNKTQFLYEVQNLIRCYNNLIVYGLVKDEDNNLYSKKEVEYSNTLKNNLLDNIKNIGLAVKINELC